MDVRNLIYMSHSTTTVLNVHHTKPLGHAFINTWIMPKRCRTPCHSRHCARIRVQVQEAWGLTLKGPMGSKCGYTHNSYKPHQVVFISLKKIMCLSFQLYSIKCLMFYMILWLFVKKSRWTMGLVPNHWVYESEHKVAPTFLNVLITIHKVWCRVIKKSAL